MKALFEKTEVFKKPETKTYPERPSNQYFKKNPNRVKTRLEERFDKQKEFLEVIWELLFAFHLPRTLLSLLCE